MLSVIPWLATLLQLFLGTTVSAAWLIGGTETLAQTTLFSRSLQVILAILSCLPVTVLIVMRRDREVSIRLAWIRRLAVVMSVVVTAKLLLYAGAPDLWEAQLHPGTRDENAGAAFQLAFLDGLLLSGSVLLILSSCVKQLLESSPRRST